ncbi:MAG: hypothetical protein EAZ08_09235 [Cytophagales bacterium]|nr:MAG: hypothetical protein EAZ08_09235 [Cytophagales bacterium]
MKSPLLYFFVLSVFAFLLISCGKEDSKQESTSKDSVNIESDPWAGADMEDGSDPFRGLSLDKKVDALLDSIDIQWYAWNKRDDERNANVLMLIKEISKLPKHNKILIDSVRLMHKIALEKKLTQENMYQPKRIDEYDKNMIGMVEKIARLLESTPKSQQCSACQNLFRQIRDADELEFILRKDYDDNVFILNEIIDKEKNKLDTLGGKYKTIKKFPVFAIM